MLDSLQWHLLFPQTRAIRPANTVQKRECDNSSTDNTRKYSRKLCLGTLRSFRVVKRLGAGSRCYTRVNVGAHFWLHDECLTGLNLADWQLYSRWMCGFSPEMWVAITPNNFDNQVWRILCLTKSIYWETKDTQVTRALIFLLSLAHATSFSISRSFLWL